MANGELVLDKYRILSGGRLRWVLYSVEVLMLWNNVFKVRYDVKLGNKV